MRNEYTPDSVTFVTYKGSFMVSKNDLTERIAHEIKAKVPF